MASSLFIYMNGYEVGEYIRRSGGVHELVYHDSWLGLRGALPLSLSLPLTDKSHKGDVVYNYFDNMLPDSMDIRNRIQARFGAKTNQPFDLLSCIGNDCVGAIQLTSGRTGLDVKKIEGIPLNESEIAEDLRNYKALPLGMSKDREFRISIAGVQEKTALLRHQGQWQRPVGATPTTHILKLPIGRIDHAGIDLSDSTENEWLCLEILRGFGLPVAAASVEKFENIKVLVVERFDRKFAEDKSSGQTICTAIAARRVAPKDGRNDQSSGQTICTAIAARRVAPKDGRNNNSWIIRLPVEDMCQACGIAPALKYENEGGPGITKIMEVLRSSLRPENDRFQFMRTVFLFWLLGAVDGHAKNFSIFLHQGGRFELTPVYDVISAYPLAEKRQIEYRNLKMAMALRGKNVHYAWHEIMLRHWFGHSAKVDFPRTQMQQIIDDVAARLDSVIETAAANIPADFPDDIAEPIFAGMRRGIKQVS